MLAATITCSWLERKYQAANTALGRKSVGAPCLKGAALEVAAIGPWFLETCQSANV